MRQHFRDMHPGDKVFIRGESTTLLPRCKHCHLQLARKYHTHKHYNTQECKSAALQRAKQERLAQAHNSRNTVITALGQPLERVTTFKYLGRILPATNSDWPALYKNLVKACKQWGMISQPLLNTGVTPKQVGMFYKAIVQSVLLYACETWTITEPMLPALKGFHHKAARRISGKQPYRSPNGNWVYPPTADALQLAGLHRIEVYIHCHQQTLGIQYITQRSILYSCCLSLTSTRQGSGLRTC